MEEVAIGILIGAAGFIVTLVVAIKVCKIHKININK